jgi:hypothetical protein
MAPPNRITKLERGGLKDFVMSKPTHPPNRQRTRIDDESRL